MEREKTYQRIINSYHRIVENWAIDIISWRLDEVEEGAVLHHRESLKKVLSDFNVLVGGNREQLNQIKKYELFLIGSG